MAQAPLSAAHSIVGVEDATSDVASVVRHRRVENMPPATITSYSKPMIKRRDCLASAGMQSLVASITRGDVESFLIDFQEHGRRPATVAHRFRSLQQFFKWLRDEGEIRETPMANMRPPHVPEGLGPSSPMTSGVTGKSRQSSKS
jgi:site-specific recombinase XerC